MNNENNKKVEEKVDKNPTKILMYAILTLLIIAGIIFIFIYETIPRTTIARLEKQNICKNLCTTKNMSYKTLDIEMNCLCTYANEQLMSYIVGIIQENNSIKEPEPMIFNRSDGTKYIMILNFTTQKIRIENVT